MHCCELHTRNSIVKKADTALQSIKIYSSFKKYGIHSICMCQYSAVSYQPITERIARSPFHTRMQYASKTSPETACCTKNPHAFLGLPPERKYPQVNSSTSACLQYHWYCSAKLRSNEEIRVCYSTKGTVVQYSIPVGESLPNSLLSSIKSLPVYCSFLGPMVCTANLKRRSAALEMTIVMTIVVGGLAVRNYQGTQIRCRGVMHTIP